MSIRGSDMRLGDGRWQLLSANALVSLAALERSLPTAHYLGRFDSAEKCQQVCEQSAYNGSALLNAKLACTRWSWHHPTFGAAQRNVSGPGGVGWARTCYKVIRRTSVPRVLIPDAHVTTGILVKAPVWGRYGWHEAAYGRVLDAAFRSTHFLRVPPVSQLPWTTAVAPFQGLTALVHATSHHALLGAAADASFSAWLREKPAASNQSGLLLITFHGQGEAEFASAAAMLALGGEAGLPLAALLLLCNNAGRSGGDLIPLLGLFERPRRLLRLLISSTLNAGYYCGELAALAASLHVWIRFPWVLHLSGPDSMLPPFGSRLLHTLITLEAHTKVAYLGDSFPAPAGQRRWATLVEL